MNAKYYLKEISDKGASSYMDDHRVSIDLSLQSSLIVGERTSVGLGIMISNYLKSKFDAEYGVSVDKNLAFGMNTPKANEDLKAQMVHYMPSMLLSFRIPAFKIYKKQTGINIEIRQNLLKTYHNPIDLEYGILQSDYTKTVNPRITMIQIGLSL